MKPVQQVFALVLEKIWSENGKNAKIAKFKKEVDTVKKTITDLEKQENKLEKMRNDEIKVLLFDEFLRVTNNSKAGNQSLLGFFGKK